MDLQGFRQQYPQYRSISDQDLADGLYNKYYSHLPRDQFDTQLGLKKPEGPNPQAMAVDPVAATQKTLDQAVSKPVDPETGTSLTPVKPEVSEFAVRAVKSGEQADPWYSAIGKVVENAGQTLKQTIGNAITGMSHISPAARASIAAEEPPEIQKLYAQGEAKGMHYGHQVAAAAAQELKKNQAKVDPDSVTGYAANLLNAGIQFAPALAAGAVDPALTLALMGTQAFGDGYGESISHGRTPDQAVNDGLFSGTVTAATGALPVGVVLKGGTPFLARVTGGALTGSAANVLLDGLKQGYESGAYDEDTPISKAAAAIKANGMWDEAKNAFDPTTPNALRDLAQHERQTALMGLGIGAAGAAIAHPFVRGAPKEVEPPDIEASVQRETKRLAGPEKSEQMPQDHPAEPGLGEAPPEDLSEDLAHPAEDVSSRGVAPKEAKPQSQATEKAPYKPKKFYRLDEIQSTRSKATETDPVTQATPEEERASLEGVNNLTPERVRPLVDQGLARIAADGVPRLLPAGRRRLAQLQGVKPKTQIPPPVRREATQNETPEERGSRLFDNAHAEVTDALTHLQEGEAEPADRMKIRRDLARIRPLIEEISTSRAEWQKSGADPKPVVRDLYAKLAKVTGANVAPKELLEPSRPKAKEEALQNGKVADQEVQVGTPTEAQKHAGNYQKGHVDVQGLDISIENLKGSLREGTGENGMKWSRKMGAPYGYIKKTDGADGDQVDVYVGEHPQAPHAFVIDQLKPSGKSFDEHKTLVGFNTAEEAKQTYLKHYPKGWKGFGAITPMPMEKFKEWLKGDTTKPLAWKKPLTFGQSEKAPVQVGRSMHRPQATHDSLLEYLSKVRLQGAEHKGLNLAEAIAEGFDPEDLKQAGHGINKAFTNKGGSFDAGAERSHEAGYRVANEKGAYDKNVFLDRIGEELRGQKHYSSAKTQHDETLARHTEEQERLIEEEHAKHPKETLDEHIEHLQSEREELLSEWERTHAAAEEREPGGDDEPMFHRKGQGAQGDLLAGTEHEARSIALRNALKKLEAQKDAKRNTGQESVETGRVDDLFSEARKQEPLLHREVAPTFYSGLLKSAENVKLTKGTPEQWLNTLKNTPGVKQEEMDWVGLPEWLKEQSGTLAREQVADFVRANQIQVEETPLGGKDEFSTKYGQQVLPGGKNYRELLLRLKNKFTSQELHKRKTIYDKWQPAISAAQKELDTAHHQDFRGIALRKLENLWEQRDSEADAVTAAKPNYFAPHFGGSVPNILAHVRFNERTDADGKRVLFLEEVQSDWHQAGRKQGYRPEKESRLAELVKRRDELQALGRSATSEQKQEWADAQNEINALGRGGVGVPSAPFKTSWPELAMKRMVRYAAENGFDRIGWTTGDQQAERYDLSKHLDSVTFGRMQAEGRYHITAYDHTHNPVIAKKGLTADEIADHLGKEIAEKIVQQTDTNPAVHGILHDVDLKVGGEGMRGFYDKMLPSVVNKLVKKWGTKVGKTSIDVGRDANDPEKNRWPTNPQQVHAVDVTDAMKEAALAGQPLFKQGAQVSAQDAAHIGAIKARAKKLLGIFSKQPSLEVVNRYEDLPTELRDRIERAGDPSNIDAFFDPRTQSIHLIGSRLRPESDVEGMLLHELVGHFGLRDMLSKAEYAEAMEGIARDMPEELAVKAKQYGLNLKNDGQRRLAAEEMLAEAAQSFRMGESIPDKMRRWINHIAQVIKGLLEKAGFSIKRYDMDFIHDLLARIHTHLGTQERRAPGEASEEPLFHREDDSPKEQMDLKEKRKGFYEVVRKAGTAIPNNELAMSLRRFLNPAGIDEPAARTAQTARAELGKLAYETSKAQNQLEQYARLVDTLPIDDRLESIDAIERGRPQPIPQLQPMANAQRQMLDTWREKIRSLGENYLDNFIENYFPHYWQNTKMARQVASTFGRRSMKGPASFLKKRTVPTIKEGMERGLKPLTTNPLFMTLLKVREMQRFYAGTLLMRKLKAQRLAKFLPITKSMPEGWVEIKDAVGRVRQWSEQEKGWIERGRYIMPENAGRVINNHLSASALRDFAPAQWIRIASNTLNSTQLGFSAFHLGFTTLDAVISKNALGIERLLHGEPLKAIQAFGEAASGPIAAGMNINRGYKLLNAYMNPSGATPELQRLVQALAAAGGRVSMDRYYLAAQGVSPFKGVGVRSLAHDIKQSFTTPMDQMPAALGSAVGSWSVEYTQKVWNDLHEMGKLYPAWSIPFEIAGRVTRASSAFIMEHVVPLQKLGVFSDLASDALRRDPTMSPEKMQRTMQRIWNSVDNRLGEMVYDNLFWNRTFKDLMHLSVRAVGWNYGTIAEIGGAGTDVVRIFDQIARNIEMRRLVKNWEVSPQLEKGGIEPSFGPLVPNKIITAEDVGHKIPYVIAMVMTVGMLGAMLTYMFTGKRPQKIKDYFFPPTGGLTKFGTPERVSPPSYAKDVYEYSQQPGQTMLNKLNPIFSIVSQLMKNEDFFGGAIANPDGNWTEQTGEYASYLGHAVLPFSVQGSKHLSGSTQPGVRGTVLRTIPYVGLGPAPASITSPEAMAERRHLAEENKYLRTLNYQLKQAKQSGDAIKYKELLERKRLMKKPMRVEQRDIRRDKAREREQEHQQTYNLIEKIGPLIEGKSRGEAPQALRDGGYPALADLLVSLPLKPRVQASRVYQQESISA